MISHGCPSQFPLEDTKQRVPYQPGPYVSASASSTESIVGAVKSDSTFAAPQSQSRASGYLTAFSFPNSASSGASSTFATEMPPKRSSPGDTAEIGPPSKQIKIENPEEFSTQVKKRLASSTRTGQACDRCKVRKIRCDGLPGGCSPCLQNNTECRTTDRITGRATSRGHVESLEQENRDMQHRIRELEQRLIQAGGDTKPSNGYASTSSYDYNRPAGTQSQWSPPATSSYTPQPTSVVMAGQQESNLFRAASGELHDGRTSDHFLGVSAGNSNLSPIRGTALSILGMEIDIADFTSLDMDEPENAVFHSALYNKSYQSFLQSALNINPKLDKVEMPARKDAFTYAEWYFRALNPYMPLLHRPTFMKLLTRWYDEPGFRPTTAETVIVHMLYAIMFFQSAARNWEDVDQQASLNRASNMHYHYSLGMFYHLSCSHTLQDVQALTLICAHLRNFPKPGASWMLTQTTMTLAIELGLHRSAKRWASDITPNPLDVEMRKRTFWSLLTIHVTLSGKLGRPMAFRMDDFDVELPDPVDDELLSAEGMDSSRPAECAHLIGLHAYRILPLYLELYNTTYAVRRQPESYIDNVNRLESKLRQWKDSLPDEMKKGTATGEEHRVHRVYAQAWALEFRLLLRHPSVSMTNDAAFNAESMRVCVESSRQLLSAVRQMQKLKSLDTTWYNSAVYVMAITTTLFAQWEKRRETSAADLAALREEMDMWLDIMGDVGALLGAGSRLKEAVRTVTDGTLSLLSRSLPNKATSSIKQEISKSPPQRPGSNTNNAYGNGTQQYNYDNAHGTNGAPTTSGYLAPEGQMTHQAASYPAATQYPALAYPTQDAHSYASFPTSTSDGVEAPLLAAFAVQASQTQPRSNSWQTSSNGNSGPQSWQQWTNTMTGSLEAQDCYSANALMQLGGRDLGDGNGNVNGGVPSQVNTSHGEMAGSQSVNMDPSMGNLSTHVSAGMGVTWPLNVFGGQGA